MGGVSAKNYRHKLKERCVAKGEVEDSNLVLRCKSFVKNKKLYK